MYVYLGACLSLIQVQCSGTMFPDSSGQRHGICFSRLADANNMINVEMRLNFQSKALNG